jgi:hypothetical protein
MVKIEKVIEDGVEYKVKTLELGAKIWLLNHKKHRIGGPAVELAGGYKEWYLNNQRYTYKDYIKKIYKRYGAGQFILLRINTDKYG